MSVSIFSSSYRRHEHFRAFWFALPRSCLAYRAACQHISATCYIAKLFESGRRRRLCLPSCRLLLSACIGSAPRTHLPAPRLPSALYAPVRRASTFRSKACK